MTDTYDFDAVDAALISAVQEHARLSIAELGQRIHLGPSATRARLTRLESAGIITGYHADVAPKKAGFALRAVVRMKVHGSRFDQVQTVLDDEPQVIRCLRITGEACYTIEFLAHDMTDLERFTSRLARIGSITTDLVYEVVVDRRTPIPQSEPSDAPKASYLPH